MLEPNLPASNPNREIIGGGAFLLNYQLKNKHVLVIGGGKEAANRTFFALDSDAFVTVIEPNALHPAVANRVEKKLVRYYNKTFQDADLDLPWDGPTSTPHAVDMVLCCIDDHVESKRIAELCRLKRIPVNCADIPELCDFYFMAQYRNQKLQIAVSTQGGGPRLGVRIRNSIVENLDSNIPLAVTLIATLRETMKKQSTGGNGPIESRMGWISRFCDSWSMEQLTTLEDPTVFQSVIDAFNNKTDIPTPKLTSTSSSMSMMLPPTLTSYWWCPKNMGLFPWLKMVSRYWCSVACQVTKLIVLHGKLMFGKKQYQTVDSIQKPLSSSEQASGQSIASGRISNQSVSTKQTTSQSVSSEQTTSQSISQKESIRIKSISNMIASDTESKHATDTNQNASSKEDNQTQKNSIELNLPKRNCNPVSNASVSSQANTKQTIYLVGAGPGHPDMLTIQAYKLLTSADIIVSDRLIPQQILDLIEPKKLILSSFKVGGQSDTAQNESNQICLDNVLQGKTVVRLKTGDPFVFGRGGEEIVFFRNYDIEPVVIPGLSSVFAAPTVNNIPVTHREVADQVLLVSGRGKGGSFPHIPPFYATRTTIFLMSLSRIPQLVQLMMANGYPSDLPAAVIQKGTWEIGQRIVFGTLFCIAEKVEQEQIENPSMFIVGDVITVLNNI